MSNRAARLPIAPTIISALITISELRKNALFSDVKVSELRRVLPTLRKEYYPRSAVICKEGEPGTCIYIILSGQVKLSITEDSHTKPLVYLNAGEFFGESAVLKNDLRSVTAEAVIDAEILLLSQNHFYDLVERDPTLMYNVIRALDTRIRMKTLGLFSQQPKQSQIVSVYSPKKTPYKTLLAVNLAASLTQQTRQSVVMLDMTMNPPNISEILQIEHATTIGEESLSEETLTGAIYHHPSGFHLLTVSSELLRTGKISREQIANTLSILKTLFQYVVINTSTEISNNTFEALDLSNAVALLSPMDEEPLTGIFDHQDIIVVYYVSPGSQPIEAAFSETTPPLLLPPNPRKELEFYQRGALSVASDPDHEMSQTIQRIARQIAGLRTGLALGGIAARGLSHIGVLKVLEEHHIPIDMICATNMGAVIGALYASGMSVAEIEQLALSLNREMPWVSIRDFNPLRGGWLSLRRMMKFLSTYIPETLTFQQLKIPLRVITMAMDDGQEVVLHTGSVLKSIEASMTIPGIFPPMQHGETFLVDGSTINPVPISDLIEMGADLLIGVNSFSPLTPSYTPPPLSYTSLVGYAENLKITDIIIRSFQNLQYEISTAKAMIADVTIAPELIGYSWNDFDEAAGIIEAGKKAAENALPEIQHVIANRRMFKKL